MMGLSFYLLDGAPAQWFVPSVAFGGALDTGLMLAVGSAVVLADAAASGLFRRGHAAPKSVIEQEEQARDDNRPLAHAS
jgi:hypothetical protein